MSSTKRYAIHEDFAKFPAMSVRFTSLVIGFLNLLIRLSRLRRKHSAAVTVVRQKISGDGGHRIELRVITPKNLKPGAPALVYYHGGAFAMTFGGMHLENAERYAESTGCITIFVCYRLAIRNPFPDGFNDAYAALKWAVDNAGQLGIDVGRIAVGGDSAGGALAAGVAQRARDEGLVSLCGQMLIYPVLDSRCNTSSAVEFVDVPLWTATSNKRMWSMYLRNYAEDATPPYAAPGLGALQDLPSAYIETAEFDPLRDEGLSYARELADCGCAVVLNETRGTIHGYDASADNETAVASMRKRLDFLKSVFTPVE
ncbi:alpha/beta hydrolase [Pseudohalioglobus lutimaris]|uniref:Alpha/beta hydrolase n=1 Tax=Pseudohalioglobus lutimaris TaxID=1737061 RepID=A0A2N5X4Q6_9GAMM|nr:alpha/beta hydrolase [Pseudohalioglobus lutimaris]PLW69463.1 alpha/beta hydrolase [Pseudohalioglobus lutimaris]